MIGSKFTQNKDWRGKTREVNNSYISAPRSGYFTFNKVDCLIEIIYESTQYNLIYRGFQIHSSINKLLYFGKK